MAGRRKLQASFTCDACGERTTRVINKDAYERGTVYVQCGGCEVWHLFKDNLDSMEEIVYADLED